MANQLHDSGPHPNKNLDYIKEAPHEPQGGTCLGVRSGPFLYAGNFYQDYFLIAFDIYPSFLFEYFQLLYLSVKFIFRNIDVHLSGQGRLTIFNPSAIFKRYSKTHRKGWDNANSLNVKSQVAFKGGLAFFMKKKGAGR